ncbi:hypothetical protein [Streptomyces sp. NPDC054808]
MARTARQILNALSRSTTVHVHSTTELAAHVDSAAAAIDKKRREKGQEAARRKPDLRPVAPTEHGRAINLTPWQVLQAVARGYVLAGQGIGRGLAEHWISLKFCEALHGNRAGSMDLTDKARHRSVQPAACCRPGRRRHEQERLRGTGRYREDLPELR